MSDRRQNVAQGLDPASRATATRFIARMSCFTLFALFPMLGTAGSAQGFAALLAVTFGIGAVFSAMFAAFKREPLGHGSLNDWDDALAFIAVSQLAHFAARL